MIRRASILVAGAMLAAHWAAAVASAMDYGAFKTDDETDKWLAENSRTYAVIVGEINGRKDLHGYRFTANEEIGHGMVVWVDGWLEIQFNPKLSGAERVTILIFEMANASRHRDHQQIDLAADGGLIRTPEEFGLAHEMIEFEALRLHRQVLLELEARAGPLPTEFFYFVKPTPPSMTEYQLPDLYQYLKCQKETNHTDHYYKLYRVRKGEQNLPSPANGKGAAGDGQ